MKKLIGFLLCLNAFCNAFSQTTTESSSEKFDKVFTKVEQPAEFPGGERSFQNYLQRNLKVAPLAPHLKAEQIVKVKFIVDKLGSVSTVFVINPDDVHPEVAQEAVRFIRRGPKWQPAKQNGIAVNYQVIQPITFPVAN
jgi:protein TonB